MHSRHWQHRRDWEHWRDLDHWDHWRLCLLARLSIGWAAVRPGAVAGAMWMLRCPRVVREHIGVGQIALQGVVQGGVAVSRPLAGRGLL